MYTIYGLENNDGIITEKFLHYTNKFDLIWQLIAYITCRKSEADHVTNIARNMIHKGDAYTCEKYKFKIVRNF